MDKEVYLRCLKEMDEASYAKAIAKYDEYACQTDAFKTHRKVSEIGNALTGYDLSKEDATVILLSKQLSAISNMLEAKIPGQSQDDWNKYINEKMDDNILYMKQLKLMFLETYCPETVQYPDIPPIEQRY